jgi:hypothetical protein
MLGNREYAFAPLRQCLDSLVTMQRLFDICVEGLDIVVGLPAILTRLESKIGKVKDDLQLRRSLDNAEFVQNERERGFPLLQLVWRTKNVITQQYADFVACYRYQAQ